MILYKQKTVEKRRKFLQSILDELIQLQKDNDKDEGVSLWDSVKNLDYKDKYKYYLWHYSSSDKPNIENLLKSDLTLKINRNNYHRIYPSIHHLCSSIIFNRIYTYFFSGIDKGYI